MRSVFISHRRDDLPSADAIRRHLRAQGFSPWLDGYRLNEGQSVAREIRDAICGVDALIAVLSLAPIEGTWVEAELSLASRLHVPVAVALLNHVHLPRWLVPDYRTAIPVLPARAKGSHPARLGSSRGGDSELDKLVQWLRRVPSRRSAVR